LVLTVRRELKWLSLGALAILLIAAVGCDDKPTRPEPPPTPSQIRVDHYSEANANPARRLPDNDVYDVFVDSQNRLWMSTNSGLAMAVNDTVTVFDEFDLPNRQARGIAELNGKIFVGTWGGGVGVYDGTNWTAIKASGQGLVDNQVFSIATDDTSAWIGTVNGASQYIDNRPPAQTWIQHSGRLSNSRIVRVVNVPPLLSVNPRRGPEVWFGTQGDGITSLRLPSMRAVYGFDTQADGLEVFAVGDGGAVMVYSGNTGTWTALGANTRLRFNAVWGSNPNGVHFVGRQGTARFFNGTQVLNRNTQTTEDLNALWGLSGNNIWAVGNKGVILQYNGSTWLSRTSPTKEDLFGVWGASPTELYAVGRNGTILQSNGSTWRKVDGSGLQGTTMQAMWGASNNAVFAVGMDGKIVLHSRAYPRDLGGGGWALMPSPTSQPLRSVFGNSAGDVYAVGASGTVAHFNGTAWSNLPALPSDFSANAVWAHNANDIFVVGQLSTYANTDDRFYRWNGTEWKASRRGAFRFRQVVLFNTSTSGIPGDVVTGIAYDPNTDRFWVSFEDYGLAVVDVDGATWQGFTNADGIVSNVGYGVGVTSLSEIWYATQDGVTFRDASGRFFNYPQGSGLPDVRTRRAYIDASDNIWLAFIQGGAGKVTSYDH